MLFYQTTNLLELVFPPILSSGPTHSCAFLKQLSILFKNIHLTLSISTYLISDIKQHEILKETFQWELMPQDHICHYIQCKGSSYWQLPLLHKDEFVNFWRQGYADVEKKKGLPLSDKLAFFLHSSMMCSCWGIKAPLNSLLKHGLFNLITVPD